VNAEQERMATVGHPEHGLEYAGPWYTWGPYVSERAWGTVREDYSADGDAWRSFTHDDARSRAYRWSEDGLAAICTLHQDLCLGLALWNGRDPILKERLFGLTGHEGNHGEDAKEYWWYLDATPSHSWLRWRYHYPQNAFPYDDLVGENARRTRLEPEYELLDTGIFDDDRYWVVEVTYAKRGPTDVLMTVSVTNAGPDADTLHVLPSLWFRDTWSWGRKHPKPVLRTEAGDLLAEHERAGVYRLAAAPGPDGVAPTPLFCDNITNTARLYGTEPLCAYPKDGINDHVVRGLPAVSPDDVGTKAAWWYRLDVPAGETVQVRLRLFSPTAGDEPDRAWAEQAFDEVVRDREREADVFYADLAPPDITPERAKVMRSAFAGMVWGKQFYRYDVPVWLGGDPGEPPPPPGRGEIRNGHWRHLDAYDILSMPDPWEYPWFAAWDLAFHCVVLSHLDPAFAKYQLVLLCREWFMHPNGALPAYEWSFDDVNPPVHAWAALKVFDIDAAASGTRDYAFLERVFQKLLLNFTWWVNREDPDGNNVFEGGFLGLDNIGPIDRSHLPPGCRLEQSDGTAWMAFYALSMLHIALVLAERDDVYEDIATKFFEHFAAITDGVADNGLWDPADGFFYDQLLRPDGTRVPLRVTSVVGLIPVLAALDVAESTTVPRTRLRKRFADFLARRSLDPGAIDRCGFVTQAPDSDRLMLTVVDPERLRRVLVEVLDEEGMLSPYGIRSLSKRHRDEPFSVEVDGQSFSVDYQPAESDSSLYGGNSNWRGPVWFPINYLVIEGLERYHEYLGNGFTVECPTGSGHHLTLTEVAEELRTRLVSIFLPGADGARPVDGGTQRFRGDPRWNDTALFYEYFNGDDGAGLGASHQTGWTGLVADLIRRMPTTPAPQD
jgi:Glycosyl hydrolase family 63 C-terminal domain